MSSKRFRSAIASQTGSYAGYSFAIPINLAKKILDDLKSMVP
jgi:S1-C subfamily serine protease